MMRHDINTASSTPPQLPTTINVISENMSKQNNARASLINAFKYEQSIFAKDQNAYIRDLEKVFLLKSKMEMHWRMKINHYNLM